MPRTTIILTLAAGLICIGAAGLFVRMPRSAAVSRTENADATAPVVSSLAEPQGPSAEELVAMAEGFTVPGSPGASVSTVAGRGKPAAPPGPGNAPADTGDELDPDAMLPMARLALSYVGTDPVAEAFWEDAINDPTLDPEDRKDLIEDLNEDGFPDPQNITKDDLPLIEARLALIERLAPNAMDETNADAFAEAKKDLLEMRAKLVPETGAPTAGEGGEPKPAGTPEPSAPQP